VATTVAPRTDQAERDHWRFSLEDYHRMIDAGILKGDDRVELIDGEILKMSPIGSRHATSVRELNTRFTIALGDRAIVSPQNPVSVRPRSEPQPDIAILAARKHKYRKAHPEPGDVLLMIEVADSSVRFDRNRKLPLYASSGIVETWLVDLVHNVVVVATEPTADGYTNIVEHKPGATIAPAAFPDITVDVAELLR